MFAKKPLTAFCDVRAADDEFIYTHDGSLLSFIRVNGCYQLLSSAEQNERRSMIDNRLTPFLKNPGHVIDFCYRMDPALSEDVANEVKEVWEGGLSTLGISFADIVKGREQLVKSVVRPDENIIAVWTKPEALTKEETKYQLKAAEKTVSGLSIKTGQAVESLLSHLQDKHKPAVTAILDTLKDAGIDVQHLSPKQGLAYAFKSNNPSISSSLFTPITTTDELPYQDDERQDISDYSGFFPFPLNEQIFIEDAARVSTKVLKIGDTVWGYIYMKIGPKPEMPFTQLVKQLNNEKVPWRVRLQVEGGEPAGLAMKKSLAFATKWSNPVTERLYRAAEDIKQDRENGIARVSFSAAFATWAPGADLKLLYKRLATLHGAVTQWGGILAASDAGDVIEGVMSSSLGLSPKSVGVKGAPRLSSPLQMLPLFQPSCPFRRPSMVFRTPEGAPWNYEIGSAELSRFFNIYIGEPGLGKSALLNSVNFAAILSKASDGSTTSTPYLGILDIGHSSKGLIDVFNEELPAHRKHLALSVKMQNNREHAVNVFDTPVGIRKPLSNQVSFLVQMLGALFVNDRDMNADNIRRILSIMIDEVYSLRADDREPNNYSKRRNLIIDNLLDKLGFDIQEATWWQVTDFLFERGYDQEALLAQRNAVPYMPDLGEVLNGDRLSSLLDGVTTTTGTLLKKQIQLILTTEATKYPCLFEPTVFDFAGARIISLDLQDVIPRSTDEESNRTAEIMYMLGRHLVASELYMDASDFETIPEPYRSYHIKRINADKSQMRFLSYDEFHRTNGRPYVRNTVTADGREARKYNIHVNLASQLIDDFDDDTLAMATGIFILGAQDNIVRSKIADRLKLTEASNQALTYYLHGPTPSGAPFIGIFKTKRGEYQHLLYHNMSAEELWMLTTTDEDVRLKDELSAFVGLREARQLLAKHFPGGSAKDRIKSLEYYYNKSGKGAETNVISQITSEIVGEIYAP